MVDKKVTYRGVDLFSTAGIVKFELDYDVVYQYFWRKVTGMEP
jgi:hypothetical protein